MVTGTSIGYVAGNGHRPLPMAADAPYGKAHAPKPKKPTGLDWDKLTPRCTVCGTKSGQLDNTDTCPTCRGVAPSTKPTTKAAGYASIQQTPEVLERRFTAPDDTALGRDLGELETEDPAFAAADAAYDDMVDRVTRPDDHAQPPSVADEAPVEETPAQDEGVAAAAGPQKATPDPELRRNDIPANVTSDQVENRQPTYTDEANLAAQLQHADRVLRDTAGHDHPAVRLLRLNAIAAIETLHLFMEMNRPQTAAPATSTPTGAAPQLPRAITPGLGGDRPAAVSDGEARRQPANPMRRPSRLDPHRDELIAAYVDGQSPTQLAARYGFSDVAIRQYLKREGVALRNRSEAQVLAQARNRTTGETAA